MKDIERRSETMLHDSLQQIPLLRADLVKRRQQHRQLQRKKLSPHRQTQMSCLLLFGKVLKCFILVTNVNQWLKLQNLV